MAGSEESKYRNRIIEQKMMSPMDLKANPKNWRKHPTAQATGLNAVLTEIGWVQSVILNQNTGNLIDGHLRIELAIKNGETEVPVVVVDLSPEEEDAILASFDPISSMAKVNHEMLSSLISGITTTNPALKDLIDRIKKSNKIEDEPLKVAAVVASRRVQLGDVWRLGRHLLLCGDCLVPENWELLLKDVKVDVCFTSPPYNIGKTAGQKEQRYHDNTDDNIEYIELLKRFTTIALEHCEEVFVNIGLAEGNKKQVIEYINAFLVTFKDIIYWVKSGAAPHIQEGVINNRVESIYCFGDGRRKFKNANFPQGTYWNVIEGSGSQANEFSDIHKATFPLYLPQNIISNFTHSGGTVFDPFAGTGTTLIAAESEGRISYNIELDPVYCDIIVARFEKLTGNKGEKI